VFLRRLERKVKNGIELHMVQLPVHVRSPGTSVSNFATDPSEFQLTFPAVTPSVVLNQALKLHSDQVHPLA
jgi:hypothetical protein